MSSSTCTYCERHLIASMANPIVAITAGTFHWDCWQRHRTADAKRKRKGDEATAARKAERAAAASERMKARWAEKETKP